MYQRIGYWVVMTTVVSLNSVHAIDVDWVGGASGDWNDAGAWNDGSQTADAATIFGRRDGSEGEFFISIENGATVTYNGHVPPPNRSDFRLNQVSVMYIGPGSTWQQVTDSTWSANAWSRVNPASLTVTGGTFRRVGTTPGEVNTDGEQIGGWLVLGGLSGSTDDQVTDIYLNSGAQFFNEGQLLFGYPVRDEQLANARKRITITMHIHDATVDLTGGFEHDIPGGDGDLVFVDNFGLNDPDDPTLAINFSGPGTIITDKGIINPNRNGDGATLDELSDKLSWEDMWARGYLQANGQSGKDGLPFSTYFTTSGQKDGENYTLTSLIIGLRCDLNNDNKADAADAGLMFENWGGFPVGDCGGDGIVDAADAGVLFQEWTGDPVPNVPEPNGLVLCGLVAIALGARRRT